MKKLLIPAFCITIAIVATVDHVHHGRLWGQDKTDEPSQPIEATEAPKPSPPHVLLTMPTEDGVLKLKASVLASENGAPNVAATPLLTDGKITGVSVTSGANSQKYDVSTTGGKLAVVNGTSRFVAGTSFEISSTGGVTIISMTLEPKTTAAKLSTVEGVADVADPFRRGSGDAATPQLRP